MDDKKWNGCKQICQDYNLTLLKTNDEDELKFLKSQLQRNTYWISLTHHKSKEESQQIGDRPSKLDSAARNSVPNRQKCAYLSSFSTEEDDCARTHGCICEKRLNKFPIPGSCAKGRTQSALQRDEDES